MTTRDERTIQLYDNRNHLLGYLGRDGRLHANYTSFGSPIYHVMQDSKGVFWLSSKPDGLFRVREGADGRFCIEQYCHEAGNLQTLSDNEIYYTAEDQHGRLWVATFNQGICCVENPWADQLVFLNKDNGLVLPIQKGMRVRQIHITPKGILLAVIQENAPRNLRFPSLSKVQCHPRRSEDDNRPYALVNHYQQCRNLHFSY